MTTMGTADICDLEPSGLQIVRLDWQAFGGQSRCWGEVVTLRLHQGNRELKTTLDQPGQGRVLVVDNGGRFFSVVGDNVAGKAIRNGWAGLFVNGYIRDSKQIKDMSLGLWALGTCPRKGPGDPGADRDSPVHLGGAIIKSGQLLFADEDGVILIDRPHPDIRF